MINLVLKHTGRFVFLVLLQVLVLNNVQLGGYINPYLYVFVILILPLEIPRWVNLFIAFFLGFCIDVFSSTLGMHIAATVFMAYCRPYVLRLLAPRDDYEFGVKPTIRDLGWVWFSSYAAILIFLHHIALFYIEIFRFSEFFSTFSRAILSTGFTFVLVIITQLLSFTGKRNK